MNEPKLRTVIVDDEPLARDELRFLLSQCDGVEIVGEAADATQGVALCEIERPHVAFVDLRMPGPDGIALSESLRARSPDTAVVMVSAHDDGAVRAYEAEVVDYLLKPVRLERLRSSLDRVRAALGPKTATQLDRIAVRVKGAYVVVDIADVVFFEVRDELVWVVTSEARFVLDKTLTSLESELDPDLFFRSHRSAIVRVDRIRAIEPAGGGTYHLTLDHPDEPKVPLARERAKQLRVKIPFPGSA